MRLIEKYFNDKGDLTTGFVYYNEEITKGLYFALDSEFVEKNINTLNIDIQIPNSPKEYGIRFSKQYEMVVVTITILDGENAGIIMQFIIKDKCKVEDIFYCNHFILKGLQGVLINALELLYINNLKDANNWMKENYL